VTAPGPETNICSYAYAMLYLRRRDAGRAAAWWAEIELFPQGAPGIVRELTRGVSVACDPTEAEQALAWARAQPDWIEDAAPLYAHDPNG
jgi:hypothetical protein